MGKLVVSRERVVVREVPINKARTTLGRRPYNDIVIDFRAVSGEHAAFDQVGSELYIEDLKSTNGTYLNGDGVKRHLVVHGDIVALGMYSVQYLDEALLDPPAESAKTVVLTPEALARAAATTQPGVLQVPIKPALLQPLDASNGLPPRPLDKVVTTVGRMGQQVVSIARRPSGFVLSHVEGPAQPTVNGEAVARAGVALKDGDVIGLSGQQWRFVQR